MVAENLYNIVAIALLITTIAAFFFLAKEATPPHFQSYTSILSISPKSTTIQSNLFTDKKTPLPITVALWLQYNYPIPPSLSYTWEKIEITSKWSLVKCKDVIGGYIDCGKVIARDGSAEWAVSMM